MRRQFHLPETDNEYLAVLNLPWEAIKDGATQWVLINDFPVLEGYNISKVNVAVNIQPGYPVAPLDMAYFFPHLQLLNRKQIGALAFHSIDGKVYQRWSRHRTAANPWRPGLDDLSTHLELVKFWFERELRK